MNVDQSHTLQPAITDLTGKAELVKTKLKFTAWMGRRSLARHRRERRNRLTGTAEAGSRPAGQRIEVVVLLNLALFQQWKRKKIQSEPFRKKSGKPLFWKEAKWKVRESVERRCRIH